MPLASVYSAQKRIQRNEVSTLLKMGLDTPLDKMEDVLRSNNTHTVKALPSLLYRLINMFQLISVSIMQGSVSVSSYPLVPCTSTRRLLSQILIYSANRGVPQCAPTNITPEKAGPISEQATLLPLAYLNLSRCHGG